MIMEARRLAQDTKSWNYGEPHLIGGGECTYASQRWPDGISPDNENIKLDIKKFIYKP